MHQSRMDPHTASQPSSNQPSERAIEALAPFAPEVGEAFRRYLSQRDMSAADEVVIAILKDHVPSRKVAQIPAKLTDESTLMGDLGIDSVSISDAVFVIEEIFDVSIANKDLATLRTVGDLRNYLRDKLATASDS